jgi:hypothetical protein
MAAPRRWLSALKPQPVSQGEEGDLSAPKLQPGKKKEEDVDTIPLQNMERGAVGGVSEPRPKAPSFLSSVGEEDETEVDDPHS